MLLLDNFPMGFHFHEIISPFIFLWIKMPKVYYHYEVQLAVHLSVKSVSFNL